MAQFDNNTYARPGTASRTDVSVDQGLRSYMLGVYNYMSAGVALTGLVANALNQFAVQNGRLTDFGHAIYGTPLKWVVMLAPIGIVLYLGIRAHRMSATGQPNLAPDFARARPTARQRAPRRRRRARGASRRRGGPAPRRCRTAPAGRSDRRPAWT